MDRVVLSLIIGGASLVGLTWAVITIVWENLGSRNVALAAGTLFAAILLFVLQLAFELRPTTTYDFISTDLTLDRKDLTVREWAYTPTKDIQMILKAVVDVDSSAWLAKKNPSVFKDDSARLFSDLTLYSLVNFIGINARDWQLRTSVYKKVPPLGVPYTVTPLSKDGECSVLTDMDFKARLAVPENLFAEAPLIGTSKVCLPPGSELVITGDSLTIRNPVCEIIFRIEVPFGSNPLKPGAPNEVPLLVNGLHQFDTRQIGVRVKTTFFGLRSQRLDIAKYKDWGGRLISGAREWFEN